MLSTAPTGNGKVERIERFDQVDNDIAAARRKFDAACEALQAFEPDAAQLEAAAVAIMKVVAKGLRPARNGSDE